MSKREEHTETTVTEELPDPKQPEPAQPGTQPPWETPVLPNEPIRYPIRQPERPTGPPAR